MVPSLRRLGDLELLDLDSRSHEFHFAHRGSRPARTFEDGTLLHRRIAAAFGEPPRSHVDPNRLPRSRK